VAEHGFTIRRVFEASPERLWQEWTEPPVEVVEAGRPEGAIPLEPLGGVAERLTSQPRRAELCCSAAFDQAGALEHSKVLGHRLDGNRKRLRELVDGRLTGGEPLEDRPPRRIRQRGEGRTQLINHLVE
jgi:hypothetical protein